MPTNLDFAYTTGPPGDFTPLSRGSFLGLAGTALVALAFPDTVKIEMGVAGEYLHNKFSGESQK